MREQNTHAPQHGSRTTVADAIPETTKFFFFFFKVKMASLPVCEVRMVWFCCFMCVYLFLASRVSIRTVCARDAFVFVFSDRHQSMDDACRAVYMPCLCLLLCVSVWQAYRAHIQIHHTCMQFYDNFEKEVCTMNRKNRQHVWHDYS